MDGQNVEALLRGIIVKNSRLPIRSLADDQVLAGEIGFDSLALVMTLAELEELRRKYERGS